MLSVRKAACCKGCIFVSEGCCSFKRSPFLAVGDVWLLLFSEGESLLLALSCFLANCSSV